MKLVLTSSHFLTFILVITVSLTLSLISNVFIFHTSALPFIGTFFLTFLSGMVAPLTITGIIYNIYSVEFSLGWILFE